MIRKYWPTWAIAALLILPALLGGEARAQNTGGTLLPSLARTTTASSADIGNTSWRGAHVTINVTAFTSGTFTPTIQGKDPISGTYYTILAGSAIAGTGLTVLRVYPGITVAANLAVSDILPTVWRITVVGAATPSAAYSVGFRLMQ